MVTVHHITELKLKRQQNTKVSIIAFVYLKMENKYIHNHITEALN